ncbi:FAD-dependent oxidoreductase [Amphibacillus cookii]|uniref:FAD-dependent oxidoreductase n=1 Tax=Amphibacillus cookii TaxID=767787 RepID=UPI00195AC2DC|nr:FAD-dependent oxidoreductase [Amphibacillus cookii]MBM7542322.1 fumarate reductase flavoprotein subunit [Amphibacillus cookii]
MKKRRALKHVLILFLCFIMMVITGCSDRETTNDEEKISFEPGTYTAEIDGNNGPITVEVTFSADKIENVTIVEHSETEGLGDDAMETIASLVVEEQSLDVDTVTGATVASDAILKAVEDAVTQANGNVLALKNDQSEKETETLEADVAVIGAGTSGTSAAISAADQGAKVILIEKTGVIGGASNYSWAGKFYNSSISLENDVEIDVEKEISDWIENNHWRVDASVIREYVTKSGETYDWLKEKGYETSFLNYNNEPLHVLPPYEEREGLLRAMLANSVEKNDGQIITETTAKELITDQDGNVVGVIAEKKDGTTLEIKANSVVMATGGYAGNPEMVKEHFEFEGPNGGLSQNVGEGLHMAWDVGAKVPINLGGQMLHQTLAKATHDLKADYEPFQASYPLMLTYLPNFMNVGPSGARFRDEEATLTAVAAANTSAFQGAYHYVILSKTQIEKLTADGMNGVQAPVLPGMPPEFYADFADQFTLETPWTDAQEVFDKMVENGDGFKGDTIEALAENAGMDVELFTDTFTLYEEATETGVDTEFGKSEDYLLSYDEGPYYAITAEVNNLGSVGGLVINKNFQVLDDSRIPIKGLYAVGLESEGVMFNDTYVGNGVGVGYAFTSGRLGGEHAATDALATNE